MINNRLTPKRLDTKICPGRILPHFWKRCLVRLIFGLLLAIGGGTPPLFAHTSEGNFGEILDEIGFDQRTGEQLPLDATFTNEQQRPVQLGDYFTGQPVVLWFGYLSCPNLCPLSRHGLVESLTRIALTAGEAFQVVMISIDPTETAQEANQVKHEFLAVYNRPGAAAGWHILTGDHAQIDRVTDAVGFRYAYDTSQAEYAHASGVVLATGAGRIARYIFGIEYQPRDLRLGLVEAAENTIATPIDRILLFCYDYNPLTGQYNLLVLRLVRLAGVATVALLGFFIWRNWRPAPPSSPQPG